MSSELSLETLLSAINALKAEVSGLASGLRSAEDRITRLEAAAYTPTNSPPPSEETSTKEQASTKTTEENQDETTLPSIEDRNSGGQASSECSSDARLKKIEAREPACPGETLCEIQHHLLPVNEGIASLAKQLQRIEQSIAHSKSNDLSTQENSQISKSLLRSPGEEQNALVKKPTDLQTLRTPRSTGSLAPSRLRNSLGVVPNRSEASFERTRPVFGKPSTPSRSQVPQLNIDGSPFGDYANDRSPFGQLTGKGTSPRTAASLRSSTAGSEFRGLGRKSSLGFGTS